MDEILGLLFLDRNLTHKEHLKTKSFAAHMALGTFYEDVIGLADKLAEAYQGCEGIMEDIPLLNYAAKDSIDVVLEKHMGMIESLRHGASELSAIQNIIDEIVGLYLSTLYKLRNLS